jgi:hypothetical protein
MAGGLQQPIHLIYPGQGDGAAAASGLNASDLDRVVSVVDSDKTRARTAGRLIPEQDQKKLRPQGFS